MQEYQNVQGSYKVDSKLLEQSKDNLILMHPCPRTGEIASELDSTDKLNTSIKLRMENYLELNY